MFKSKSSFSSLCLSLASRYICCTRSVTVSSRCEMHRYVLYHSQRVPDAASLNTISCCLSKHERKEDSSSTIHFRERLYRIYDDTDVWFLVSRKKSSNSFHCHVQNMPLRLPHTCKWKKRTKFYMKVIFLNFDIFSPKKRWIIIIFIYKQRDWTQKSDSENSEVRQYKRALNKRAIKKSSTKFSTTKLAELSTTRSVSESPSESAKRLTKAQPHSAGFPSLICTSFSLAISEKKRRRAAWEEKRGRGEGEEREGKKINSRFSEAAGTRDWERTLS